MRFSLVVMFRVSIFFNKYLRYLSLVLEMVKYFDLA